MPERIQLSRKRGWRKPENTVVVARPSKWGNPFTIGERFASLDPARPTVLVLSERVADRTEAVELYRRWLAGEVVVDGGAIDRCDYIRTYALRDLTGLNLACWCPLDQPCHADVLLEIANGEVK